MSYDVIVRHTADSGDGISVEAKVEGVPVAHTFSKGRGWFEEPDRGRPRFIQKLEDKYEEKMKRQSKVPSNQLSSEESKIHASYFENKVYSESETFKTENNLNDDMEDVDVESPEQIRKYLKDNMAEGYLSESEEENIDRIVNSYTKMLNDKRKNTDKSVEELIREIYTGKVL